MKKLRNFLNESRERRINGPELILVPENVTAKKEPGKIAAADYHTVIRNYNEYAKIPKLITI